MTRISLVHTLLTSLALAVLPLAAHAQAYKCKQANGSTSFQDSPCPTGAAGSALTLKAPAPSSDPAAAPPNTNRPPNSRNPGARPPQPGERDYLARRADEETRVYNEQVTARNRQIECGNARQQLGVVREQRPVYSRNSAGDREYITDSQRQGEIAAAERRAAQACQ